MSKHDAAWIKKFQPKQSSDTPVMDFLFDFFKMKERHRKHRLNKKRKHRR